MSVALLSPAAPVASASPQAAGEFAPFARLALIVLLATLLGMALVASLRIALAFAQPTSHLFTFLSHVGADYGAYPQAQFLMTTFKDGVAIIELVGESGQFGQLRLGIIDEALLARKVTLERLNLIQGQVPLLIAFHDERGVGALLGPGGDFSGVTGLSDLPQVGNLLGVGLLRSPTPTPAISPTPTPTSPTIVGPAAATSTPPPATATPLPTESPEPTAAPLPTATPEPTPTNTPLPIATSTPEPTATPLPTETPLPTPTPEPTSTLFPISPPPPTATWTPLPTATATPAPVVDINLPGGLTAIFNVANVVPGSATEQQLAVSNNGNVAFTYALTVDSTTSSLLDQNPTNGLQLTVVRCDASFTVCSEIYAGRVVISNVPLGGPDALAGGQRGLRPGSQDFLRIRVALPATAGNEFQDQQSVLRFSWTATEASL